LIRFARQLRKTDVTILHCYLPRANFFGAIAGRIARVPVVLVSKRSLEPQNTLKQGFFCRMADFGADVVLANSKEVWRHAAEVGGCRPEKLHLVPNGIDVEVYRQSLSNGFHGERPVVGTVLRLEPVKGPEDFVETAGLIAAAMPETRFVIIGDGSMRAALESRSRALGLGERLQFLGERDDVAEILRGFSVFLLPSLIEGMSMALLEAMAAARPIVATRVGGNLDLVRDQETGLLVSPGKPDEMAAAVLRLLKDNGWARSLGLAAQDMVANHYSADGMVAKIERIYSDVLAGKGC
jgi:glycosyltransferase involved in cell wall biosynthesis